MEDKNLYTKSGASRAVKKMKKEVENKPYWENTSPVFNPEWIKYKQPEKAKEEEEEDEEEKGRPKGIALLKKVYGGCKTSCKAKVDKRYNDVVGNYKKVVSHLEEHISEKQYDKKDVEQSRHLRKEIDRINQLHLVPANQIPKTDHLYQVSNPREVQRRAKEIYNETVYKSTNPKKKYQMLDADGKWVYFGEPNYEDFTKHADENRRNSYLARATKIKGNWRNNPYSPNWLAILLLW